MKKKSIELPNIDPEAFHALCQWIYDKASPPNPTEAANLQLLVELWVAAGKLGLHEKQNTLMRIGMALMQPKEFVCSFATVRWVYEHTAANSSLRPYIITIFCERGPPFTTPGTFTAVSATLGISCDAFQFTQVLSKVRASNPKGKEEYDLSSQFGECILVVEWPKHMLGGAFDHAKSTQRAFKTLVTDGKEVDWSKIEYPLPDFLVFGEKWEVLLNMHLVTEAMADRDGIEVLKQIR